MTYRQFTTAAALAFGLAAAFPALADVTIEQSLEIRATGPFSTLTSAGTLATQISGERSHFENQLDIPPSALPGFAEHANTATIVDLRRDRVLQLQPREQQYVEMTLEQLGRHAETGEQALLPVSGESCQWSGSGVTVKKTPRAARIGGIRAQQSLLRAERTCTAPASGKACTVAWSLESWNARSVPGGDEAQAFRQGFANATGGDPLLDPARLAYAGLLTLFRGGWDELFEAAASVSGYPVKTVMRMDIGGERCTLNSGVPIARDDAWLGAAEPDAGGPDDSAEVSPQEAARDGLGSTLIEMMGAGGSSGEETGATGLAEGMVRVFTINTEVTRITTTDIDPARFEAPAGWRPVSAPDL
jgi:hypothetical protein